MSRIEIRARYTFFFPRDPKDKRGILSDSGTGGGGGRGRRITRDRGILEVYGNIDARIVQVLLGSFGYLSFEGGFNHL